MTEEHQPARLPECLLVANRGEIARRVIATARRLGIRTVAVHTDVDAGLPFVAEADVAVAIGPGPVATSYLDGARVLGVALEQGCDAVHPGYGFLSESAEFAEAVAAAGLVWVGPSPDAIRTMGDKITARRAAREFGVPVGPGHGTALSTAAEALAAADEIGYPVMVKASGGGGGIGMARVADADGLAAAFEATRSRAERSFASSEVYVERYIDAARHVEVQVLGTADGEILVLGDRECSVQRRHQKVIEESPATDLDDAVRRRLHDAATAAARSVGYRNAGTVEFLVDRDTDDVLFLEMNTRLQVEHPVTELVTGVDLVEQQLRIAAGAAPTTVDRPAVQGHAIELRVYAEDPERFLPAPGEITRWIEPTGEGVRVDSGYCAGTTVTPYYDPLLAKLCVHAPTRREALERARDAVDAFVVEGPGTNLPFLARVLREPTFVAGRYDTGLVDRMTRSRVASAS